MPVINQSEQVPYSAAQMYALVDDFEAYPSFLPWCERSWVVSRNGAVTRAGMSVRKGRVHYSFVTDNTGEPPDRITIRLAEGPFQRLVGSWSFASNALGCRVTLALDFEFESRLVGAVLSPVFRMMTNSLVSSFRQRAAAVYGRG